MRRVLILLFLACPLGCEDPQRLQAAIQQNREIAAEIRENATTRRMIAEKKQHLVDLQAQIDKVKLEIAALEKR